MATVPKVIDVEEMPELNRLAEEVRMTREPLLLRKGNNDLAVIRPVEEPSVPGRRRVRTQAELEAFLSTAGGWKDVDTDQLLKDIYESRDLQTRPPVEL